MIVKIIILDLRRGHSKLSIWIGTSIPGVPSSRFMTDGALC